MSISILVEDRYNSETRYERLVTLATSLQGANISPNIQNRGVIYSYLGDAVYYLRRLSEEYQDQHQEYLIFLHHNLNVKLGSETPYKDEFENILAIQNEVCSQEGILRQLAIEELE